MFIRYISHEIRTPLNTVFLGLKLLQDDFVRSNDDVSRVETVKDIKESCDIAINILNELLMFDKLESGILKLELKKVSPWTFVNDVIKPFFVQVISR